MLRRALPLVLATVLASVPSTSFAAGSSLVTAPATIENLPVPPTFVETRSLAEGSRLVSGQIAIAPEDEVWMAGGSGSTLDRVNFGGLLTGRFSIPPFLYSAPNLSDANDGSVWFTSAGTGEGGAVGKVSAAGNVKLYPPPEAAWSGLNSIIRGSEQDAWLTTENPSRVIHISATGAETPISLSDPYPAGIALDRAGDLWIGDTFEPLLVRIAPSGAESQYNLAAPAGPPVVGAEGDVWFSEPLASTIGRITPSGTLTEYGVPGIEKSIALGDDGNLWFGDPAVHGIARMSPSGSFASFGPLPEELRPLELVSGMKGDIWFTTASNQLARLIIPSAPIDVVPPALSGDPREGSVLSSSTGEWTEAPTTYSYQWELCDAGGLECAPVPGETSPEIALSAALVSHKLRMTVVAQNSAGRTAATSSPSAQIASIPSMPVVTVEPPVQTHPSKVPAGLTWVFDAMHAVRTLRLAHLQGGNNVEVLCAGRGCSFSHWRAKAVSHPKCRGTACALRRREVGSSIDLAPLFAHRPLSNHAKISVTVTDAGSFGVRYTLILRGSRQAPTETLQCLSATSARLLAPCP